MSLDPLRRVPAKVRSPGEALGLRYLMEVFGGVGPVLVVGELLVLLGYLGGAERQRDRAATFSATSRTLRHIRFMVPDGPDFGWDRPPS